LDAESETAVNEALGKLMESSSTTISIAHRLSTIAAAKTVIVLNNKGSVAEIGTFEELSSREGPFTELMRWQLSGGEAATARLYHGPPSGSEEAHEELVAEEAHHGEEEPVKVSKN
jgi:putative ABC transport system ATP-binding protein